VSRSVFLNLGWLLDTGHHAFRKIPNFKWQISNKSKTIDVVCVMCDMGQTKIDEISQLIPHISYLISHITKAINTGFPVFTQMR
jgi:hypothetical protein